MSSLRGTLVMALVLLGSPNSGLSGAAPAVCRELEPRLEQVVRLEEGREALVRRIAEGKKRRGGLLEVQQAFEGGPGSWWDLARRWRAEDTQRRLLTAGAEMERLEQELADADAALRKEDADLLAALHGCFGSAGEAPAPVWVKCWAAAVRAEARIDGRLDERIRTLPAEVPLFSRKEPLVDGPLPGQRRRDQAGRSYPEERMTSADADHYQDLWTRRIAGQRELVAEMTARLAALGKRTDLLKKNAGISRDLPWENELSRIEARRAFLKTEIGLREAVIQRLQEQLRRLNRSGSSGVR